jgi:hypothetical protein
LPGFQKQRYNPANANTETALEKISSRQIPGLKPYSGSNKINRTRRINETR